jgi:transcription initiation factor IIF auxiliary subunit
VALVMCQDETYISRDRWEWSVWIDGPPEELDALDRVVYVLHPTYHDPVRTVKDRSTKFRLHTSGWGTFTIHAKAIRKDGGETLLEHELVLRYPDGMATLA